MDTPGRYSWDLGGNASASAGQARMWGSLDLAIVALPGVAGVVISVENVRDDRLVTHRCDFHLFICGGGTFSRRMLLGSQKASS